MIYLNQWTGEMFHSQKECEKTIDDGIKSCLITEEILDRTAMQDKLKDLLLALYDEDSQEIDDSITNLNFYLSELRSSEMDYAYAEAEDKEEKELLEDGWTWGD